MLKLKRALRHRVLGKTLKKPQLAPRTSVCNPCSGNLVMHNHPVALIAANAGAHCRVPKTLGFRQRAGQWFGDVQGASLLLEIPNSIRKQC